MVPVLEIEDLRTYYHTGGRLVRAVDSVSLSIDSGAKVGLAGASGSGKTQTARSILGLIDAAPGIVGGSIRVEGEDLLAGLEKNCLMEERDGHLVISSDVGRWRRRHARRLRGIRGRRISMVFQEPTTALVPYQTVAAHLRETHAALYPTALDAAHAEALLARLGFAAPARLMRRYPHELSGGEAQRVMLALALLGNPRLLIADEPTTALDMLTRRAILDLLIEITDEDDRALLLISHDLALLRHLVEEVVLLFAGTVVERGPVASVLDAGGAKGHPYTAALLHPAGRVPAGRVNRKGCRYVHRCPLKDQLPAVVQQRCLNEPPPEVTVGAGHRVACWARAEEAG